MRPLVACSIAFPAALSRHLPSTLHFSRVFTYLLPETVRPAQPQPMQRRATLCGRAPGRRSWALWAKMPFEFPIRRAYDRYAIDTRDQEGCVVLRVIDVDLLDSSASIVS